MSAIPALDALLPAGRPCDRRAWLRTAAASAAGAAVGSLRLDASAFAGKEGAAPGDSFCAFTESFQSWEIERVCEKFQSIGLQGLDLTLRPGGHIDPNQAEEKLPLAVAAASKLGMKISMLTTAITDADAASEKIVATAGKLGVERIKLGYYRRPALGELTAELDNVRRRIEGVAKMARRHNVLACVHIHSGETIPASGPISYLVLKDFSPSEVGAYVDPMHMTLEGGGDGWRQGLELLAPWIAISSLKNFRWDRPARDERGQMRWRPVKCPLADGMAPIPDYIGVLRALGYRGLYTLHSEYCDSNSWKNLSIDEALAQTAADLAYAQRWFA